MRLKTLVVIAFLCSLLFVCSVVRAQQATLPDLNSRWTYGVLAGLVSVEQNAEGVWESNALDKAGAEWGIDLIDADDHAWVTITNPHAFRLTSFAYYSGLAVYFGRGLLPAGSGIGIGVLYPFADLEKQEVGFEAGQDDLVWVFSLGFAM